MAQRTEVQELYTKTEATNGKWYLVGKSTDKETIYKGIVDDFLARDFKYPSYVSMRNTNNYDGTRTLVFYYEGVKKVYIIKKS